MATGAIAASDRFLDPAVLAGVRDLALVARRVVEGFFAGRHPDVRPGVGTEFSQYRAYQPGDDLRRVDWRVYGRTERLVVREAEVDRDVTVRIVLDASRSMAAEETVADASPVSKLRYGVMVAACLAYLAERQGDRFAFHAVGDGGHQDLEPMRRGHGLPRLVALLDGLVAGGRWPDVARLLPILAGRDRERQLVVVISDLYDHGDEMVRAFDALIAARNDILVLQVMGRAERALAWRGNVLFEDLETGERVRADADTVRSAYRQRVAAFVAAWRRRLLDRGIDHHLLTTDEPLDAALRAVLVRRRALPA